MLKSAALSNITVENIGWKESYAHRKRPRWILEWISKQQARRVVTAPAAPTRRTRQPAAGVHGFDEVVAASAKPAALPSSEATQRPLDDWDVIMFVDGSDSAFTGENPQSILHRFQRIAKEDIEPSLILPDNGIDSPELRRKRRLMVPLLFNAEANCYHQQLFDGPWGVKKGKCLVAYKKYNPYVVSKWRYLNAGGWIGYVWAAKRFFTEVAAVLDKRPKLWCDQSLIGGLMLSRRFDLLLHLDYANAFYLPTYHLDPNADLCRAMPGEGVRVGDHEYFDDNTYLRLCHSGGIPAVLHFNGKSGEATKNEVLQKTAWYVRSMMPNGKETSLRLLAASRTILYGGGVTERSVTLSDVCKL